LSAEIQPLRERDELHAYIEQYWASGHILARSPAMAEFTYATPWVDQATFPSGYSVLGAYTGDGRLIGFLGAIVAPYPRPQSYWLALWHVLPELKGTGMGGRLLKQVQDIALAEGGWIGTFGAGPDALPVYLNRGYTARGARRWIYSPEQEGQTKQTLQPSESPSELAPPESWFDYRFARHPVFDYEQYSGGIFRTEENEWGRVTHAVWLDKSGGGELVHAIYEREDEIARRNGQDYILDAWSFEPPGTAWRLAPPEIPSVFHPPEPRGNMIFAVGLPFLPGNVQKGDCDQDRPN
jgi:hypothetical protein